MFYIENRCTDPARNLAMEEHLFETLPGEQTCLMLWQNRDAVIVGKYQNTAQEIDGEYAREHQIRVVRRMSGGGAVFHDLGNLNYTFIGPAGDAAELDFGAFCRPVLDVLARAGVRAEASGRNDLSIDGRKISGAAQYVRGGRVLHHGTLLFCSDLDRMQAVLTPRPDKIRSNGAQSVRSRVTNIRDHLPQDMELEQFWRLMGQRLAGEQGAVPYALTREDWQHAEDISARRYGTWAWNYGSDPDYSIQKTRRVPQCGTVGVGMEVEKGRITALTLYGDFFCCRDPEELTSVLVGRKLERADLEEALGKVNMEEYVFRLTAEELIRVLLE